MSDEALDENKFASTKYVQQDIEKAVNLSNEQGDPGLLLVRGKNGENKAYIKSLSHAVLTVIAKYGYANLKCVGASAINNALKSVTIASGEAMKRGVDIWVKPSFQEAMFNDVEKTAMMLHVRGK